MVQLKSTDLIRIQHRGLVHQTFHSSHASIDLCIKHAAYKLSKKVTALP